MILGFSTQLNGKPTYFISKIWAGISSKFNEYDVKGRPVFKYPEEYIKCGLMGLLELKQQKPKLHTIREDKNNRWKVGTKIDFFINCRQKNMFRFTPVLPVVSTQKVEIKWMGFSDGFRPWVKIDGKLFYDVAQINKVKMLELANNDGFDTVEEFFDYFNKDFVGKIIHWTDLKY